MNYFASQGRKYQVLVHLSDDQDQFVQAITIPMFSNSHLDDVRDIIDDFHEKLDLYPTKYNIPTHLYFTIISMRDRKNRLWINDNTVYGGLRLEAQE